MAEQYREQEVEEVIGDADPAMGAAGTAQAAGPVAELGGMGEPPVPEPAGQGGPAQAGPARGVNPQGLAPGAGGSGEGGSTTPPLTGFGSSTANPIAQPGPLRPGLMPPPQVLADLKRQNDSIAAVFTHCQVPQEVGMVFMKTAGITD